MPPRGTKSIGSSPHTWGSSGQGEGTSCSGTVFPTRLGVVPARQPRSWRCGRLPHARGGLSLAWYIKDGTVMPSPYTWGSVRLPIGSPEFQPLFPDRWVPLIPRKLVHCSIFPTHVGSVSGERDGAVFSTWWGSVSPHCPALCCTFPSACDDSPSERKNSRSEACPYGLLNSVRWRFSLHVTGPSHLMSKNHRPEQPTPMTRR